MYYLGDIEIRGRIILKVMLRKYGVEKEIPLNRFRIGPLGFCEICVEPWCSLNTGTIFIILPNEKLSTAHKHPVQMSESNKKSKVLRRLWSVEP